MQAPTLEITDVGAPLFADICSHFSSLQHQTKVTHLQFLSTKMIHKILAILSRGTLLYGMTMEKISELYNTDIGFTYVTYMTLGTRLNGKG